MAFATKFSPGEIKFNENTNKQQFNHVSHRHPLSPSKLSEEDKAICSGCEHDILGPAYICTKSNCPFLLHDFCVDLPRRVRHHSHPKHPLGLFFSPPYDDGEFMCDACGTSGHGFTYHCGACKFDLHVECASLPEVEKRKDHEHPLILLCGFDPDKVEGVGFSCYVCNDGIGKGCWSYCCLDCKCGTHLECVGKLIHCNVAD